MGESFTSSQIKSIITKNNSNLIFSNDIISKNNIKSLKYNSNTNTNKKDNSLFPFYSDYNNKFNYILQQIKDLNEHTFTANNKYKKKVKKILAFKENIFVHNKNISLIENKKNSDEIKYKLKNKQKNKFHISNFNSNILRPKSANVQYNSNSKNSLMKSKLFLDQEYFDISYIKNDKANIRMSYSKNKNKNNKSLNNNRKSLIINNSKNKKEYANNYTNYSNLKLRKKNRPQIFMKRPIPTLKAKYLFCLPKDLIKDTKNKYNFFSYILTDDIYNRNYSKGRNKNKNKTKSNKKFIRTNFNFNNNIFNNFLLKSKIEKMKIRKEIDKVCNNIISKDKKIYKPVQMKISQIINKKQKMKQIDDDIDTEQKIKSHPFLTKKKSLSINK